MPKATLRDIAIRGKRLFVRVDFNVPLSKAGEVTDDTRIRAVLPTLTYALQEGASVILASHLGRPRGKVDPAYSLRPVAARLQELLGKPVRLAADCVGADTEALAQALAPGEVLLLENLRFHPRKRRMIRRSRKPWRVWARCTSTMPLARRTGRMRRRLGLRPICSQRWQDCSWSRRLPI